MSRASDGLVETRSPDAVHWLAVVRVLAIGVVHVYAGVVEGRIPDPLVGVRFLDAVALFLADVRRPLLYLVWILHTGVQLPLWYVANAGEYTTVGYTDESIQVLLVVLLAYLYWRQRGPSTSPNDPAAT